MRRLLRGGPPHPPGVERKRSAGQQRRGRNQHQQVMDEERALREVDRQGGQQPETSIATQPTRRLTASPPAKIAASAGTTTG